MQRNYPNHQVGKPDAKVLVVANPANTNANILMRHAPKIPRANFTAMTRLDHNRARAMLAAKAGGHGGAGGAVAVGAVKNMIIWGNHSATQVPDAAHAIVGGVPAREAVLGGGDDGAAWLEGAFTKGVQQRGAAVIAARGASSAMSAANGAADHMRDWLGSYGGSVAAGAGYTSMAVCSDGNPYQTAACDGAPLVPEGLIYSFPCSCEGGKWYIVPGLDIDARTAAMMRATAAELLEEKAAADDAVKAADAAAAGGGAKL